MLAKFTRHKLLVLGILLLACGLTWLVVRSMPATEAEIRRSTCFVEGKSFLCLASGKDTIVLMADSIHQQGVWINRHWWWPSCDGRVLTIDNGFTPIHHKHLENADTLRKLVAEGTDSLGSLLKRKEVERKELIYYLRSHGVIDEGYTQIATYANAQKIETDSLTSRYRKLLAIKNIKQIKLFRKGVYKVSWYDGKGKLQRVNCQPIITNAGKSGQPVILHTQRSLKPWGVYAVRNVPWGVTHHKKIIVVALSATNKLTEHHAILVTGHFKSGNRHDLPRLFATDGSPVFSQHGRYLGIISRKEVMP